MCEESHEALSILEAVVDEEAVVEQHQGQCSTSEDLGVRASEAPTMTVRRESAFQWYRRSHRKRKNIELLSLAKECTPGSSTTEKDPIQAAWEFFKPNLQNETLSSTGIPREELSSSLSSSGIPFLDAIFQKRAEEDLPWIDIRWSSSSKSSYSNPDSERILSTSMTLMTLACRFLIHTAMDQQDSSNNVHAFSNENLPHVLILDGRLEFSHPLTFPNLLRAHLLRETADASQVQSRLERCLERLHLATAPTYTGDSWIPLLYALRSSLRGRTAHTQPPAAPILVLVDGVILREDHKYAPWIVKELSQLRSEQFAVIVTTSGEGTAVLQPSRLSRWRPSFLEKEITDRVLLEPQPEVTPDENRHAYLATVYGTSYPFSIASSGISC